MTDHTNTISAPVVHIADTDVTAITYRGERVVTFAIVDQVHQRPDGTAKRAFHENRARFVDGEDYVLIGAGQKYEFRTFGLEVPNRGLTVLTRRGYLKLVKPMTDDRAWEVQGEMIDRYFLVEKLAAAVEKMVPAAPGMLRETRLQHKMFMGILRDCGIKGNQAAISANQATKRMTGVDLMGVLGITHIDAEVNEPDLSPTSIGLRLGISGQKVNHLLCAHGYQLPGRDAKGHVYYELTDKGREAGGVFKDTGKPRFRRPDQAASLGRRHCRSSQGRYARGRVRPSC